MKKITRDLKKHYRGVEKNLRDFNIDLSEKSWYRMWHIHLDWYGITSVSHKDRKKHILYYLKIFDKISKQANETERDFQTWLYLDGHDGADDALYFHTENPKFDFPYYLDNIEWVIEVPSILIGLIDLATFNIGVLNDNEGNLPFYIIQKKGLGLKINEK
ncbi:hypothetical protein SAMN02745163_02960 [Clostridium cavendishii DSM 21758]|uniref:Uncharacterized protein n=1 Tax=Clostridium cavendishii DSM 21758 TaxID=1121302 RepID=A0A1M6NNI4_9CLOT|nr:hypothetical protein [Clostridium cavendishii]SHJ97218.1 hypothetical protein SAMN02745163_02960 [Clostridium cavendishii DSM 21758]